jgi:outer membrane protein assembly factor BamB
VELRRVERFEMPARPALTAPVVEPVWTFAAGSPLWAGPTYAAGTVFAGAEDGSVHAVDARTGKRRWVHRTGGRVRTRPTVSGRDLYVQADDGFLYKLDVARGSLRWRVRIVERPIERLPFDDPKSRYDRFGSDVVVSGGRLLVGTHDGAVLALDPRDGARVWAFHAGDAVLAAPAVANGRVLFGSYDRSVYALDAKSGRELWRRDTRGAVVSTPAVDGGLLVVGTRAYDLLGLDAETGAIAWKRYVWMSWVESNPTLRDGVAYVGSSDAAAVFAVEAATGKRRWTADVRGWSWGQPAVTAARVYAGTSSQVGYLAQHSGAFVALDRETGAVAWRYPAAAPAAGPYGFPGSPALGEGLVFAGGLDGTLVALRE